MATIKVTCGLIFDGDKIFICRRKPEKSMGGYWEFPGGKVEEGESYQECLKRELIEELDMKVEVFNHFKTVLHDYDNFQIELIAYTCSYISSSYRLSDHDRYEWLALDNLLEYDLAPADIPMAKQLLEEHC
ncbi:(deoxy)nucleoside triphosphate pyrophosphohydrolase [Vibrio sp. HN007]|uniref:(deoxy)nucleoside triphosphate pyrophosphohydrolase n=1 Tax=Vibrio iocasae TaxID=3098914 RepID=UPI0035D3FECF